jgi:hypothetical protein
MPRWLQRAVLSPVPAVAQGGRPRAVRARLVGRGVRLVARDPQPAPTFVYVVFWVSLTVLVVLVGDVWSALDPWRTVADAAAWVGRRAGIRRTPYAYPAGLGVWPAVALLFAFVTLELVYDDPADPRVLAVAILVYSLATWTGAAVFGREAWRRNGDGFALYFSLLSRLALVGTRTRAGAREAIVRRPLAPLTAVDHRPGIVAFVAVMLGSVAFDGFSRSSTWQDFLLEIETSLGSGAWVDEAMMAVNLATLLGPIALVALVFELAVGAARRVRADHGNRCLHLQPRPDRVRLRARALPSYLLVQGQFALHCVRPTAAVGPHRYRGLPSPPRRPDPRTRPGTRR